MNAWILVAMQNGSPVYTVGPFSNENDAVAYGERLLAESPEKKERTFAVFISQAPLP
jgi:hypothetical protein